jgi:hypothetical protein
MLRCRCPSISSSAALPLPSRGLQSTSLVPRGFHDAQRIRSATWWPGGNIRFSRRFFAMSAEEMEMYKKKLLYRSKQRGMKETILLIGSDLIILVAVSNE